MGAALELSQSIAFSMRRANSLSPPLPHRPLDDGTALVLSQIAIKCIYQFLDCYNILPHTYLCRLLALHGLVPRLHSVIRQVCRSVVGGIRTVLWVQGINASIQ